MWELSGGARGAVPLTWVNAGVTASIEDME
jgi:hypothetical protein